MKRLNFYLIYTDIHNLTFYLKKHSKWLWKATNIDVSYIGLHL